MQLRAGGWMGSCSLLFLAWAAYCLFAVGPASAFEQYYDPGDPNQSGNCKTCHPSFDQKGNLHDMHVSPFTSACDNCHLSRGDNPFISKIGDAPFYGCVGCHGRDYGKRSGTDVVVQGFGLRRRHVEQNGVILCRSCHSKSGQLAEVQLEPLPECMEPPAYGGPDVVSTLTDSCNPSGGEDGDESWKIPNPEPESLGLDNDGDGMYDMADPDCTRSGPGRIVNVMFMSGTTDTIGWTDSPDADTYQVLRGSLSDLRADRDFRLGVCVDSGAPTNSFVDPDSLLPGEGFYYLVRGVDPGGTTGTYDSDGAGQLAPRDTTAVACP